MFKGSLLWLVFAAELGAVHGPGRRLGEAARSLALTNLQNLSTSWVITLGFFTRSYSDLPRCYASVIEGSRVQLDRRSGLGSLATPTMGSLDTFLDSGQPICRHGLRLRQIAVGVFTFEQKFNRHTVTLDPAPSS
jgi:hypothetical protein